MAHNVLPLAPPPPSYARKDYVVLEAGKEALTWIDTPPSAWPSGLLILTGENGSGKTHLTYLWQEKTGAQRLPLPLTAPPYPKESTGLIVDGLLAMPNALLQEYLLHLCTHCRDEGIPLLLTAAIPFWHHADCRPELASRLASGVHVPLEQPDEALLEVLLHKHAADRQLLIPSEVAAFLLPRLPRGYAEIQTLVERLDTLSLAAGRKVSLSLARQALERA